MGLLITTHEVPSRAGYNQPRVRSRFGASLLVRGPLGFGFDVTIALIKGVTIAFCCWAGKIPHNQICFLTSLEPDKVYSSPKRNNKGVAVVLLSGRKRPDSNRFPSTCPTSLTSCSTWSYQCPIIYYCDPLPSVSPDGKTSSGGGGVCIHVTVTLVWELEDPDMLHQ